MPPISIRNKDDLSKISTFYSKEIISRLKVMKISRVLPKDIKLIGIADGYFLGVFKLIPNEYGYKCYRIYLDSDKKLIISDVGYQVTNMGKGTSNIDCEMTYLIKVDELNIL